MPLKPLICLRRKEYWTRMYEASSASVSSDYLKQDKGHNGYRVHPLWLLWTFRNVLEKIIRARVAVNMTVKKPNKK